MKTSDLILFSLFTVFLISCSSSKNQNENTTAERAAAVKEKENTFFTIDFAEIIKDQKEVPLSEIAESVKYIQLENSDKALLGNVFDVQLTPEYIFIKHSGSRLLAQFSCNGEFIRNIGTEGRGPKEYGLIRKFSLDQENRLIYIHTNWTHKVIVFNFDGEFVRSLRFPTSGRGSISWSRDSFLVSFSEPEMGNEPYTFIETNFNGDTIQTVNNHIFWGENDQTHFMVSYWGRNVYYRTNDKLQMKSWYNDTVYTFSNENKIVPAFFIDLKHHKLPNDQVYERKSTKPLPEECYWVGVNESSKYIFIRYGDQYDKLKKNRKGKANGCVYFDKLTKKGTALKRKEDANGFINDINGGPQFLPRFSNDSLIFVEVSALDMKTFLESDEFKNREVKSPAQKEVLTKIKRDLKEDDNHILMLAKLKE